MSDGANNVSKIREVVRAKGATEWLDDVLKCVEQYRDDFAVTRQAVERIIDLLEIRSEYDLQENEAVFDEELLNEVSEEHFPNDGTKELAVLYLVYRREGSGSELARVSDQAAAMIRNLRDKGFLFFNPKFDDGVAPRGQQTTYTPEGKSENHRKIIRYNPPEELKYLQASTAANRRFLRGKRDPLNGTKSNLEVDHRMPLSACRRAGVEPKTLTDEMIKDGRAEEHFQALSRKNNSIKREVCQACLRGEEIRIPPAFERYASHYKRRWEDGLGEDSCKGCFWYNPVEPETPLPESTVE